LHRPTASAPPQSLQVSFGLFLHDQSSSCAASGLTRGGVSAIAAAADPEYPNRALDQPIVDDTKQDAPASHHAIPPAKIATATVSATLSVESVAVVVKLTVVDARRDA
jgi:hypothetical protein